jgi:hypothetical protein
VLAGLAVQPLVAALLAFVTFPLTDYTGRLAYGGRPVDSVRSAIAFAIGVGIVGLATTVLGALPVLGWALKRGPLTRRRVIVAGAILGNIPSAVIVSGLAIGQLSSGSTPTLNALTYGYLGLFRIVAFGSFVGLGSAAVFWWLAGRHVAK